MAAKHDPDDFGPLSEIAEAAVPPASTRRPMRMWDLLLSIVLLLIMVLLAAGATFAAPYVAFARTGCEETTACLFGTDAVTTTLLIAPGAVSLVGSITAVALLAFRKVAFWVPVVGILLIGTILVLAVLTV